MKTFRFDNLRYTGLDGSLGYRTGTIQPIMIGVNEYNKIYVSRAEPDYGGLCIYETESIFSKYWSYGQHGGSVKNIIRKIKLMKIEIEAILE